MALKIFGILAFVVLTLQCFDAATIWRLNCGTSTSYACKDQFKDLFIKISQLGQVHNLNYACDFITDAVTKANAPKYLSEDLFTFCDDVKRRTIENRHNMQEIEKIGQEFEVEMEKNLPPLAQYMQRFASQAKPEDRDDPKPYRTKVVKDIVLNTLDLFDGLRAQDYEQLPEMRGFKDEFENLKQHINEMKQYSRNYNNLLGRFADYLGVSHSETFRADD